MALDKRRKHASDRRSKWCDGAASRSFRTVEDDAYCTGWRMDTFPIRSILKL